MSEKGGFGGAFLRRRESDRHRRMFDHRDGGYKRYPPLRNLVLLEGGERNINIQCRK
jgi:hypothetical protein